VIKQNRGKKMGKWMKSLKWFARNKKAISALETAIVLIAFIIVASAFAYAMLNMGFLATQKSQQVIQGGLAAASSALLVDGPVYGYSNAPGPNGNITSVIFWLKTAEAGTSVDLNVNKTTIGFQNPRGVWPNIYNSGGGPLTYSVGGVTYTVCNGSCDSKTGVNATTITWEVGSPYLLSSGEKVRVTIDLTQLSMTPEPTSFPLIPAGVVMKNEEFKVLVKPPVGSVLEIDRFAPASVASVNDLG
jgi:flagellin FlaB